MVANSLCAWPALPPSSSRSFISFMIGSPRARRTGSQIRDAADIFRLMQTVPAGKMMPKLRELVGDAVSAGPTGTALDYLPDLFGAARSVGVVMASRALQPAVLEATIAAICNGFAREVANL